MNAWQVMQTIQPMDDANTELLSRVRPPDWVNPTPRGRYNMVVLGGGTAGLVSAMGAAALGARVALVERGLMGGDCLNHGCVPSKAILHAARQAAAVRDAGQFGIDVATWQLNFAAVMQRMRRLRATISPHDSAQRLADSGIDVFFGQGCFTEDCKVAVDGQTLAFAKAVIATGASAARPNIEGLAAAGYLTNETLFSIDELPKRLLVIGGGPMGCEMAQGFARFGSRVTVIQRSPQILKAEIAGAAEIVQQSLAAEGVQFELGANIVRVESSQGSKTITIEQGGQEKQITGDEILLAAGRAPNVDGLGLESIHVAFDRQRGVTVNDRLQTSNRRIFAAGDVCSRYQLTHAADFYARIVIQNCLFLGRAKASALLIPRCTYTSPEVAAVGVDPQNANRQGIELTEFTQRLEHNDRAVLDSVGAGFVRVYCRKGTDRILGGVIVSPHAGEMIGQLVMAIRHKIRLKKLASIIQPYPTQSDAIRSLGDQYNRTRLTPPVRSLMSAWLSLQR